MQHHKTSTFIAARKNAARRATLTGTVQLLWPYIWPADRADLKLRVFLAIALMLLSKLITIAIPYSYKWATDAVAGKLALNAVPLPHLLIGAAALTVALWGPAHPDGVHSTGARRSVRSRRHARGAPIGDRSFRALASTIPALSSGAQDRRAHARSRARPQRRRNDHSHLDADRGSDDRRVRAGHRRDARLVRLALCRGDQQPRLRPI